MSLANIFAGIGGAFTAVQKGMDDAQFRKDKDQERQWRTEDRQRAKVDQAFQDEQRGVWRKQQTRADDEYQRGKTLQDELAANLNGYTGGDAAATGTQPPAAAATPAAGQAAPAAADKVTAPNPALGDQGVATVEPGAASAPPAEQPAAPKALPKRMTWSELQRKNAASLAKAGKADDALKLIDAANTWDHNEAQRGVARLMATADGMSNADLAKSVEGMYTNDPLPTNAKIVPNADGSFDVTVSNPQTGVSRQVKVKDKAQLLQGLQYHYSPEVFLKNQQAAQESAMKRREELLKPFTLKPGEVRQVYDETTGKVVTIGEGGIKPGYELVTSPNGEVIQRPIAKDGKGGKQNSVADIVLDQATKGEFKLTPTQISDAQLRAAQMSARGTKDYVAANVGLKVAQDPTLVKPSINLLTGEIDGVYKDSTVGDVVVDKGIATARDPNGITNAQMQSFAKNLVESADPTTRDQLVQSAFSPDARAKFESGLRAQITKQFDELIAKRPNAKAQLEAERDAYMQSSLQALSRKLDLINGHYPKPKDEAATPPRTLGKVGGLSGAEKYVPPADSPAGKAAARRQEQQDARAETERLAARSRAERAPGVSSQAADIVKRGDMAAAYRLQQSPDFDLLTREEKVAVYKVVNGIKR